MTMPRPRSLRALGSVISVLVIAVVLVQLVWCVRIWQANHTVVEQRSWGTRTSHGGIDRMPFAYSTLGWLATLLVAGLLLLFWLWRARANAELLCTARHRFGRGWVIGAWFTPAASFVLPPIIVSDIVRASDPATPANRPTLQGVPGGGLVWAWWAVWALAWPALVFERTRFMTTNDRYSDIESAADAWTAWAMSYTVMTALFALAAALLITILVRVDGWQSRRFGG
ncbi:DUF4328 domain-containing protein [Nocardia sp. NPDC127579]|uniref:DUF4328 domain-containing protein n=1 Tax=Nocardia sp. NPDC127579 TaxID=3345402 RepID=UPI003643BDD5